MITRTVIYIENNKCVYSNHQQRRDLAWWTSTREKHSCISAHTTLLCVSSYTPERARLNGKRTRKYVPGTPSDSALTPACGGTLGQVRTLQQSSCRSLRVSKCCPAFPMLTSHDELTSQLRNMVHSSASLLGSSLGLYSFFAQG